MRLFVSTSILFQILIIGVLYICIAPYDAWAQSTSTQPVATVVTYTTEALPNADVIGDFVVGPGKVEVEVEPGVSRTVELLVSNRTGVPRDFIFSVEDITGSDDGSQAVVLLGDDSGAYTLRDYIALPMEPITLEHAERARVMLEISVPEDAEPGGRYGSVLVQTVSSSGTENSALPRSPIVARIGTLFFVTVPGDIEQSGALQAFTTIPDTQWFANGPIDFSLLYRNTGSVHLNPYGEIRITNMLGEEVGFIEIEPWFALPQSLRLREVSWDRELLFGRYTATAHINRGYDDVIDTQSIQFYVVPWKLLAALFIGILFIIYILRWIARTFEFRRRT